MPRRGHPAARRRSTQWTSKRSDRRQSLSKRWGVAANRSDPGQKWLLLRRCRLAQSGIIGLLWLSAPEQRKYLAALQAGQRPTFSWRRTIICRAELRACLIAGSDGSGGKRVTVVEFLTHLPWWGQDPEGEAASVPPASHQHKSPLDFLGRVLQRFVACWQSLSRVIARLGGGSCHE